MRRSGRFTSTAVQTATKCPTIGRVYFEGPEDPRVRAYVLNLFIATDPEQAERWRSTLAAGKLPNLSADPPIVDDEQYAARVNEISLDSLG
jgi:hypothetical protein